MNKHGFAGTQCRLFPQGIVGGDKGLGDTGSFFPTQIAGNFSQQSFLNGKKLGLGSSAGDAKNSLARLPKLHERANFRDFAGKFDSGNLLRKAGGSRVSSLALQQIGAVQP